MSPPSEPAWCACHAPPCKILHMYTHTVWSYRESVPGLVLVGGLIRRRLCQKKERLPRYAPVHDSAVSHIYIRRVWSRLSGKITLHVPCVCVYWAVCTRLYSPCAILTLCVLTRRVLQVHGYVSVYEGGGWAECLRKGEDMVARSHRVMQLCAEVDRL